MRWRITPSWDIDCRYFGPRRDSAWYLLSRRRARAGWRRWLRRAVKRTEGWHA